MFIRKEIYKEFHLALNEIEILAGILTLSYVIIGLLVGLLIVLKYFKHQNRLFLLVGFSLVGLLSNWIAKVVSFIKAFITGTSISFELYAFISNFTLPLTISIWLLAFNDLYRLKQRNIIILINSIIGILFEIYLISFLIIDPSVLGRFDGNIDVDFGIIVTAYQFFLLMTVLITGIFLARQSLDSGNPEIELKGRFLILSLCSLVGGAILEMFSSMSVFILLLGKFCLIASSLEFYCGFFLPNWVKKRLIK